MAAPAEKLRFCHGTEKMCASEGRRVFLGSTYTRNALPPKTRASTVWGSLTLANKQYHFFHIESDMDGIVHVPGTWMQGPSPCTMLEAIGVRQWLPKDSCLRYPGQHHLPNNGRQLNQQIILTTMKSKSTQPLQLKSVGCCSEAEVKR